MSGARAISRPVASSPQVYARMVAQRQRDTKPERIIRSLIHRSGYRFLKDIKPVAGLRTRADIVFPRIRLAVFIDGCFWHSCPIHKTIPKSNTHWWEAKLEANRRRDAAADTTLRASGWTVIRVWEHEDPAKAVSRICRELKALYSSIESHTLRKGSKGK